jgi:hypothetical protein
VLIQTRDRPIFSPKFGKLLAVFVNLAILLVTLAMYLLISQSQKLCLKMVDLAVRKVDFRLQDLGELWGSRETEKESGGETTPRRTPSPRGMRYRPFHDAGFETVAFAGWHYFQCLLLFAADLAALASPLLVSGLAAVPSRLGR